MVKKTRTGSNLSDYHVNHALGPSVAHSCCAVVDFGEFVNAEARGRIDIFPITYVTRENRESDSISKAKAASRCCGFICSGDTLRGAV